MQLAKIEDEYSQLIKKHFNDTVKNPIYTKDNITSDVVSFDIKNKICKCINHTPKYNLLKNGLDCSCDKCKGSFPYAKIPIADEYKNILNYLNINVTVNNYNNDEYNTILDNEQINSNIFNDSQLTLLINQCLDGHKINDFSKLMKHKYPCFVYDNDEWYFCDENNIWKHDTEEFIFKTKILELRELFSHIVNYYIINKQMKEAMSIIKNIKLLKTKLSKPNFKEDIIKDAKMLYYTCNFINKLNSKKHLLAFTNGVFDLNSKIFRSIKKEDYISYTCNYNYDPNINNEETKSFIRLLINDFEFFMKTISDCLNTDIFNLKHVLLIGDKPKILQIINLINLTLGDYSIKTDMSTVTRRRNVVEYTNEKIKYLNKRFIYLHEYDDRKIDVEQILDFLFHDIVIKNNITYSTDGKIFMIYDKVNFKLFENINNQNIIKMYCINNSEYDNNINVNIKDDITWRQTCMNILLEFYYTKYKEPEPVIDNLINKYSELSTNNDVFKWLDKHIILDADNVLNLKEICEHYYTYKVHSKIASKMKKEIECYLKDKYIDIVCNYRDTTFKGNKVRGWIGIKYKE
jgi:hypothetical protein